MPDERTQSSRGARRLTRGLAAVLPLLMAGCSSDGFLLIHPRGPLADASLQAWIVDTAGTLLVIGPATLLVLWAMWRYRRVDGRGKYQPGWSHSVPIELLCWGAPFLVVLGLGFYALRGAVATDPAGPGLLAQGVSADNANPTLDIDVVATDWQWLFIYPDRHVAAANEVVLPVHTPIRFRLTSATVATDFFIPQLSGQIDVMPGMRTFQGLVAPITGDYQGFATDFNGPGFSWMRFPAHVVPQADYEAWVAKVAQSPRHLDDAEFKKFAVPTINDTAATTIEWSNVQDGLFDQVMQGTMMGDEYPTPTDMTEKKAHKVNGGRQQRSAAAAPPSPTAASASQE